MLTVPFVTLLVLLFLSISCAQAQEGTSSDSTSPTMSDGKAVDPFSVIKDQIPSIVKKLMTLPLSPVWMHESTLSHLLKVPGGDKFGPRNSLSCILKGIEKGFCGNKKKDCVKTGYLIVDFSKENCEGHKISFVNHGRNEPFAGGKLDNHPKAAKPRWFKSGDTLTDITTQNQIVEALLGEAPGLSEEVEERRQSNYTSFLKDVNQDGGFRKYDVPTIAYDYRDIWGSNIVIDERFVRGDRVQRRAFKQEDLERIEYCLRMMMVGSNRIGQFYVNGGDLQPHSSTRRVRGGIPLTPTPATLKEPEVDETPTPPTLPTPNKLLMRSNEKLSDDVVKNCLPECLLLKNIECTTVEDFVQFSRIPELAALELLFHLHTEKKMDISGIMNEMFRVKVSLPKTFNINSLLILSKPVIKSAVFNIRAARRNLIKCMYQNFIPREDQMLYEWRVDAKKYSDGKRMEASNFVTDPSSRVHSLSLPAAYLLRHIMHSHKLSLPNVLTLWASFYALIIRQPLDLQYFASQTTLWNNIHRLHYIDSALATNKFEPFIKQRSPHGFRRYFYSSSDDSEHYSRNRHVLVISTNASDDIYIVEPSFRHVTSSVNAVKSSSAEKNSQAIVSMLGLEMAAYYGGGTNDNAADAQKEIRYTFNDIMGAVKDSGEGSISVLHEMIYENGVERRPIAFGDPFHIANLCVTWASIFAFGDTEKADHSQVHHRQLLQSIHSLHSADVAFSQSKMDDVMKGSGKSVKISSKRERVQRWMVNQRNAKITLEMLESLTQDGTPSLVAWALTFANQSRSTWKRRVGLEIATWLSMPELILGLQFEAELGTYFEEIYAWHNRTGPLGRRSGFRMMEMFELYFGFEVPWWNEVNANPESKLPKTMQYLKNNFIGDEYAFRLNQIMRGLKKGREEMIKMTTRYLLQTPIIFLLLCHHEYGAPFLRSMLRVLWQNPVEDVILVFGDEESPVWGKYDPDTDKMWFDILSNHVDDVVHFWRQFGLHQECLLSDLQRLSNETKPRESRGKAHLLLFKSEYKVLFECLHAVFGLMMSNSRLCEQIHGMMRHGLRSGTGMDQVDAQQSYSIATDFEMKDERRRMVLDALPPAKRHKSVEHNKTKKQQQKLSEQLVENVDAWTRKVDILLSEPGHGIPSVSEINNTGRRDQDKKNLTAQLEAERAKTANLTRDIVTVDMVKINAVSTALSNDRQMRLGSERLKLRMKMTEMSTQQFWKDLAIPEDKVAYKFIMQTAWKAFPKLHEIVYKPPRLGPARSKTAVIKDIGMYLTKTKKTAKLVCEFLYGKPGTDKAIPKRDRLYELADVLQLLRYFRVVEGAGTAEICESAALIALSSFEHIDQHYTYTLIQDAVEMEITEEEEDDDDHCDEEAENPVAMLMIR